jgi:POT family proton-dependent oligopeptide transporter
MGQEEKHPPGLYVLFFTEMWERFGFYSMLAMFVLYLRNAEQGFGWSEEKAQTLYSIYMGSVYFSPLFGGFLADQFLGYRRCVLIGGLFFMVGYFLLSLPSVGMLYTALALLVIGNGFFKPNVSTMVGNLYPPESRLKDRAYNVFYMGINIGALLAPIVAEVMVNGFHAIFDAIGLNGPKGFEGFGYRPTFRLAAAGMVIAVAILTVFRRYVDRPVPGVSAPAAAGASPAEAAALPPIEFVPNARRITGLLVVFAIAIVWWMVYNQNGSVITYWANDNTDWKVSGIISNAINPFFIIVLTPPLVWFWKWLAGIGKEPSTPVKMTIGMFLLAAAFAVLYAAAKMGEAAAAAAQRGPYDFRVSPGWLFGAYAVITLSELMVSPMGLSLVSKVAPVKVRGLMMAGWFVVISMGGYLTVMGVYWPKWLHSTYFAVLGGLVLAAGVVSLLLLKPLKKAMPGV